MKVILLLLIPHLFFAQQKTEIRKLQKGQTSEDTSFVYQLPFLEDESYLMVQGYFTSFSHKHLIANDFKMKEGSTICAARKGIVITAKGDSDIGGLKDKENHWNYVYIMHDDSSTAIYGHLQKGGLLVKVGDTVAQGQPIALSGNTGYSAFPHLHFAVYDNSDNQIAVRFNTAKGTMYLAQWRKYSATRPKKKK